VGAFLVPVQYPPGGGDAEVPTGTGFRHVTADAEDAAAKLVENADVHATAAIAQSKISGLEASLAGKSDTGHTHSGLAPTGGTTGQVLKKASNTNYDYAWDTDETAAPGGGAPDDADYLVGTANAGLSNEIVVGTSPGGELGGTWASPTVDATHSGSSHAGVQAAAEATAAGAVAAADPHTGYQRESEKDAASGYAGLSAGSKLAGAQQTYGSGANTACEGNDARLSDARTPTTHDIISAHNGFPGGSANFLRADGTFAAPPSSGGGPTLISSGAAPAAGAANSAAAPAETWLLNTADNAVTTVETVMSVTSVPAGTYLFEYFIVWRSGATGTGVAFAVDYTGTVTRIRATRHYQSTGAAAATGVSDGVSAVLTGTLVEHHSTNADNGALGPTTGVASTTEDQFDYIRGIMVVSDSGNLNLTMTGEANGAVTFKADSLLLLKRLA
jgi:hypothetical protein